MIRFYYSLSVLALSPILPWWVSAIVLLAGILLFRRYFEASVLVFLYDLSFGLPGGGLLKNEFSFTIIVTCIILVVEWYKERLRVYK
ncbi:MAG: hypothetical protein NTY66_03495 [Candidatus Vogelbacteria bacterium]|nr:hypothetical protein [Candidatus Vogelbacteria bacterium]